MNEDGKLKPGESLTKQFDYYNRNMHGKIVNCLQIIGIINIVVPI